MFNLTIQGSSLQFLKNSLNRLHPLTGNNKLVGCWVLSMNFYRSSSDEWLIEIVAIVLACLLLGFLWYRVLTKMGYAGAARWILLVAAFLPVTALLELIWFAFVPWPSLKEFRELKRRIDTLKNIGYNPLDPELDKLREQINRKVDS